MLKNIVRILLVFVTGILLYCRYFHLCKDSSYSARLLDTVILYYLLLNKKPQIWPNSIKIRKKNSIPPNRCFFGCSLTAINASSLQLVWHRFYLGHLLPVLTDSAIGSENKQLSSWSLSFWYIALLLHWGLCPNTSTNISFFCFFISACEVCEKHDYMNFLHENRTHIMESLLLCRFTNMDALKKIN